MSPAFVRELLRKAALLAVLPTGSTDGDGSSGEIVVEYRHLDQALHELVLDGGDLTKRLLGAGG